MSIVGKRYADTDFVTGLRAIAALGVVLIHSGGAGLRELGPLGNRLADLGASGVTVFFVISGFSVASSFAAEPDYGKYLIKRLRRIVPLYWAWLAITLVAGLSGTSDWALIVLHFLFASYYFSASNVIGVEWTLAVEVVFYAIVPFALVWASTAWRIVALLIASYAVNRIAVLIMPDVVSTAYDPVLYFHYSPLPYALCFALGVAAFRLRQWATPRPLLANIAIVWAVLAIALSVIAPSVTSRWPLDQLMLVSAATFAVIAFGTDRSRVYEVVLCNPVVKYLGRVSYGIYLAHLAAIAWFVPSEAHPLLAFLIASIGATALASVTYFVIEQPASRLKVPVKSVRADQGSQA